MDRRRLLLGGVAAAGLGAAAWYGLGRTPQAPRPRADFAGQTKGQLNILFVLTDQERAWADYPEGFIEAHCPGRSKLLERGVHFTHAYTPTQLCSMARGVVYSGLHSQNNEVWENVPIPLGKSLNPGVPTLGTMMQDAGYRTGYAGKWHLSKLADGQTPLPPDQARAEVQSYGFEDTEFDGEIDGPYLGWQTDGRTVERALRFIERNKQGEKPWFLAVNLLNPHDIMYYTSGPEMTASRVMEFPDRSTPPPPDPFYQQDLGYDVLGHWGPDTRKARPPAIEEYAKSLEAALGYMEFDDVDIAREFQNYYWNCTRDCDRHLAALLAGLEASGEADRTIIVFTSDHGEFLGVHGLRGKGVSGYREGSNVPALVVHPDVEGGTSNPALVSHLDWAPTLLGLAGIDEQSRGEQLPMLKGHDISGAVGGEEIDRFDDGVLLHWTSLAFVDHASASAFKPVFEADGLERYYRQFQAVREVNWQKRGQMRGMYDGRWKFARYFSPGEHHIPTDWENLSGRNDLELYDTKDDPDELVNLAYQPEQRDEVLRANAKTNALIAREIGTDDGAFLPGFAQG